MKANISWVIIQNKIEPLDRLAQSSIFQVQSVTSSVDAYLIANAHKIRLFHHPKRTYASKSISASPHTPCTYIAYNPCTGLTKIGRSTNHETRLDGLQRLKKTKLKVIKIIEGDHELVLHYRYHSLLIDNEWFNLKKKHYKEIREYAKKHG
jgi:hypothetical protein